LIEVLKNLEKHRLRDISRIVRTIEHPVRCVENRFLVSDQQCFESLPVTLTAPLHQLYVVWLIHTYSRPTEKLAEDPPL